MRHSKLEADAQSSSVSKKHIISMRGLEKSYDGKTIIVEDLNLDIVEGEFLTFLGPSGSGKTTTLMMLAGFEHPDSGSISIDGKAVDKLPPYSRGMGMVFQNYALFPHMTVAQNVAYPLRLRKYPTRQISEAVTEALTMVQMAQLGDRKPANLSGGQQQRVALARALVFHPKIVLMDEPLGALDKQLRERMQYEIRRIHIQAGCTTIYVTHDQSEAMVMSDRIAIFSKGGIEQIGTPDEIYYQPKSLFVASFIGENNILHGRCSINSGAEATFETHDGASIRIDDPRGIPINKNITISVRPEAVSIYCDTITAPASLSNDAEVAGTVGDVYFLGDHTRVTVKLNATDEVLVKVDPTRKLSTGEHVKVRWAVSDIRVFEE